MCLAYVYKLFFSYIVYKIIIFNNRFKFKNQILEPVWTILPAVVLLQIHFVSETHTL